jgi:uncharacterized protein YecT (DUF1311 family)
MPQVNLSTLSGPELRRLLDTTRERGQAALSYQILQEMAARREGRGRWSLPGTRSRGEPRTIALNLGDPLEPEDELPPLPAWSFGDLESQASATPEPEPEPVAAAPALRRARRRKTPPRPAPPPAAAPADVTPDADLGPLPTLELRRPRSVWDDDPPAPPAKPARRWALRPPAQKPLRRPPALEGLRAAVRRHRGPGAGFAAGIAAGLAVGWWMGGTGDQAPPPSAPPITVAAASVLPITLAPRPAPPLEPLAATAAQPPVAAAPDPAAAVRSPELREGPVLSADAAEVVRDAATEAMELPPPALPKRRTAEATPEPTRPAAALPAADRGGACAAEPTPADRRICGDPQLRRLQAELREAYAEALAAHEDRTLLRQRQLAWRDARNTVSEPDRLARLYEQRIRKLNAATAEARRER